MSEPPGEMSPTPCSSSSPESEVFEVPAVTRLAFLTCVLREHDDWLDAHENRASKRRELEQRLETMYALRPFYENIVMPKLMGELPSVARYQDLIKSFDAAYAAVSTRARVALNSAATMSPTPEMSSAASTPTPPGTPSDTRSLNDMKLPSGVVRKSASFPNIPVEFRTVGEYPNMEILAKFNEMLRWIQNLESKVSTVGRNRERRKELKNLVDEATDLYNNYIKLLFQQYFLQYFDDSRTFRDSYYVTVTRAREALN